MVTPVLVLSPREQEEVRRVLAKYRSVARFYAFGSRVKGGARKFSDLDILIQSDSPLTVRTLGALERDFSESKLRFRVDLVDASRAAASFLAAIADQTVEL